MTWNDPPQHGEVWRRRYYGKKARVETRHVIDRTMGSDVIYVAGRWSRGAQKLYCTETEWLEWQQFAKRVT